METRDYRNFTWLKVGGQPEIELDGNSGGLRPPVDEYGLLLMMM